MKEIIIKSYLIIFCVAMIIIGYLGLVKTNTQEKEYKKQIDSLKSEIFSRDLQISRYECIIDQLEEIQNPLLDSIISNTE